MSVSLYFVQIIWLLLIRRTNCNVVTIITLNSHPCKTESNDQQHTVTRAKSCQRPMVARDISDDFQSLKTVCAMHESAVVFN